jgi:hypothetical protein
MSADDDASILVVDDVAENLRRSPVSTQRSARPWIPLDFGGSDATVK